MTTAKIINILSTYSFSFHKSGLHKERDLKLGFYSRVRRYTIRQIIQLTVTFVRQGELNNTDVQPLQKVSILINRFQVKILLKSSKGVHSAKEHI